MCFAQLLQVLQGVSWSADSIWLALFLHEGFPGPFHVTSLGRLLYEGTHGASISSDPTGLAPLLLEGPHGAYVHIPSLACRWCCFMRCFMERAFTHQLPLGWRCCFMGCSMERASHISFTCLLRLLFKWGLMDPAS